MNPENSFLEKTDLTPDNLWVKQGHCYHTVSGAKTTTVPRFDFNSDRKTQNTISRMHRWLIENAIAEAHRRDDRYNARYFDRLSAQGLSSSDLDLLVMYLWDAEMLHLTSKNHQGISRDRFSLGPYNGHILSGYAIKNT